MTKIFLQIASNGKKHAGLSHLDFVTLFRERRLLHDFAGPVNVGVNICDLEALCEASLAQQRTLEVTLRYSDAARVTPRVLDVGRLAAKRLRRRRRAARCSGLDVVARRLHDVADGVLLGVIRLGVHQACGGHVLGLHRVRRRGAWALQVPGVGFRAQVVARTGRTARVGGGTRAAGVLCATMLSPLPFSTAADSISKTTKRRAAQM